MTPPESIQWPTIDFGDRARSVYAGIEQLAQSILDNGLIQPLVLVPIEPFSHQIEGRADIDPRLFIQQFGLDAGGRRYKALEYLLATQQWNGTLYHAVTSEHHPLRVGYILKGEAFATPLQRMLTELAENLDREDMDWRDQTKLIVKAWNLALTEAHADSRDILMRDGGAMLKCGYMDLRAAVLIHDDLIANPDRYRDCASIRHAHTKLLKENERELTRVLSARSIVEAPKVPSTKSIEVSELSDPKPEVEVAPAITIPLTSAFGCCDSLDYMAGLTGPTFDHIVTDPDYGVSVERLEAGVDTQFGVHQDTVQASLYDTFRFIELAFRIISDKGFLVFWYDLDHHEKFQNHAIKCGFRVQRWPLIWIKTDYRANASPQSNFCKNIEYAMVCRKPGAVLSRAQMSSVYSAPSAGVQKDMGHPFAKPVEVSKWIYSAIAIKGQTVYDPFMGSGALSIAAIEWGLKPSGSEINVDNYSRAILNLQKSFRKLIGSEVNFS